MDRLHMSLMSLFCEKFGQMLHSGIPIQVSLETLREDFSQPRGGALVTEAIGKMLENIQQGKSLTEANDAFFSSPFVQLMFRAGEQDGTLDYCLLRIAKVMDKELSFSQPGQVI